MFASFFKKRTAKRKAYDLYNLLVKQARLPAFYTDFGVEDSLEGRFDMVLLHLFLIGNRLEEEGSSFILLRRFLQEAMVSDMDRSFREMGIGDMSVGKEMKKVGSAWLGRQKAYGAGLAEGADDQLLHDSLLKNLYNGVDGVGVQHMVDYMKHVKSELLRQDITDVASCSLDFPSPEAVLNR